MMSFAPKPGLRITGFRVIGIRSDASALVPQEALMARRMSGRIFHEMARLHYSA
jgi:hypothetical protein